MSNRNIFELGDRGFNVPQWIHYFNKINSEREASSSRSTTSGSVEKSRCCSSRCAVWSLVTTALVILLLGTAFVPLILYLIEEGQFKYYMATATLTLQGQYDKNLGDLNSTLSIEFQKDFCRTMGNSQQNKYTNDYKGCLVTEIRNGSIVVSFSMFFYTKVIVTSNNVKTEITEYWRKQPNNVTFANTFNVLIEIETLDVGVIRQEQTEYESLTSNSQFVGSALTTTTIPPTTAISATPGESSSTSTTEGSTSTVSPATTTNTQADTTLSSISSTPPIATTVTTLTTTSESDTTLLASSTTIAQTTSESDTTESGISLTSSMIATVMATEEDTSESSTSTASLNTTTVTSSSDSTQNFSTSTVIQNSTTTTPQISSTSFSNPPPGNTTYLNESTTQTSTGPSITNTTTSRTTTNQNDSTSSVIQNSTTTAPQISSKSSTSSPTGNTTYLNDSSTETSTSATFTNTTLDSQDTSSTNIPTDTSNTTSVLLDSTTSTKGVMDTDYNSSSTSGLPDASTSSSWDTSSTSPTSLNMTITTVQNSDNSTITTDFSDLNITSSTIPSVTDASSVNISTTTDSLAPMTSTTISPQQLAAVAMDPSYGEIGTVVRHTCRINITSGDWEQIYLKQYSSNENLAVRFKNGSTVTYTNDSILTPVFEVDASKINASVTFNLTDFPEERCGSRRFEFVCSVQMKTGLIFNATANFKIIAPMTPPSVAVRATRYAINTTSNETFVGVLISCNVTKDQSNESAQDVGIRIFNSTDHQIAEFVYFPERSGIFTPNCGEWVFVNGNEPTVFSYRSDFNGSTLYCFLQNAGAGNKVALSNSVTLTFGALESDNT
ncbi:mucin-5AC-like [Saccostrea echinata]|uniref:mucin-5AC-like n=1 Tax=Saccostrea echinata TaxID=191078 RepID=UPI002A82B080|nr:mucin-5AC-like [Saccostrea echinata]